MDKAFVDRVRDEILKRRVERRPFISVFEGLAAIKRCHDSIWTCEDEDFLQELIDMAATVQLIGEDCNFIREDSQEDVERRSMHTQRQYKIEKALSEVINEMKYSSNPATVMQKNSSTNNRIFQFGPEFLTMLQAALDYDE